MAVVGAGTMGEAFIRCVLADGCPPEAVVATAAHPERLQELVRLHGVDVATSNADAVSGADIVLLAVKPTQLGGVLDEIAPYLPADAVVVSIVVGWTTERIESALSPGASVVRVMPNLAAVVAESTSVMSAGSSCSPAQLDRARGLMAAAGKVFETPEALHDVAAIVCGGAPAIYFAIVDAVVEGAVSLGLPRATARELAVQSLAGSAALLVHTGEPPVVLREKVSSPGGAAIAGGIELDRLGARHAVVAAVRATYARARELGQRVD